MNEQENKVAAALATGEPGAGGTGTGDNAELNAELEKAKHQASVWAGRAKKSAEEKAALEEELRKLKAQKTVDDVAAEIPAELKGDTPDETLKAALTGSKKLVDDATGKTEEEIAKLRTEMAANNAKAFVNQLAAKHSAFFELVGPGGANAQVWEQFKAKNRETFNAIMASQDVSRFDGFVSQFCSHLGIPDPSGKGGGTAIPEPAKITGGPQNLGGGAAEDKTEYTQAEYLKQLEAAEDARYNGDMKTYREVTARLTKALNEGRVKG